MGEKHSKSIVSAPEFQVSADGGFESWHRNETTVHVNAKDEYSGIKNISCYVNGEKQAEIGKAGGNFCDPAVFKKWQTGAGSF